MGRNRKNQAAAVRFGPALKAVLLCVCLGGSGVGYVWQKAVIDQIGQEIKKREVRLRFLEDQNVKLRQQLATMRSDRVLEARIRDLNLGLARPDSAQVWRLPEPVAIPVPENKGAPQVAVHQAGEMAQ
jgi:hypothetical protein